MELKAYGQCMQVDVEAGAAITHLTLGSEDHSRAIISSHANYHYQSSLLFPFPNRLKGGQYRFNNTNYQFLLNDFGRPNALHGFVHDQRFEIVELSQDKINLRLRSSGDRMAYPFKFELDLTYSLLPGKLDIRVEISNSGDRIMPCGFGWHPYFNIRDDKTHMLLSGVEKIEIDEDMIPTGKRTPYKTFEEPALLRDVRLDTCFRFLSEGINSTSLYFVDGEELQIWQDHNYSFVQVFTPDDGKTIAIEPMTCGIDALNSGDGLKKLSPGESWAVNCGLGLK